MHLPCVYKMTKNNTLYSSLTGKLEIKSSSSCRALEPPFHTTLLGGSKCTPLAAAFLWFPPLTSAKWVQQENHIARGGGTRYLTHSEASKGIGTQSSAKVWRFHSLPTKYPTSSSSGEIHPWILTVFWLHKLTGWYNLVHIGFLVKRYDKNKADL